ncbi:arginase family protein [Streptomyces muensis]|uniref:Arginase family protein n=1 Tax=Streptomyces muensis TaxID=1077944 RepID=A0A9X1PV79_STRM4|nr:arginase family protein [Streptomyces muensis]MCF1592874.1 arginase family protein [Streptomyces muensis]
MTGRDRDNASPTVLVIPQWQGSAARHPRRLAEGAHRLGALLPTASRTVVDIDPRPGQDHDGVGHLDALTRSLEATRTALRRTGDGATLLAVGGDCGIELAPVARAVARHGDSLAVVWFDAHADLNTPETSPSGGFHGMVLRTLIGQGPSPLVPEPEERLSTRRIVLAGVRALDPAERDFIDSEGIRALSVQALRQQDRLLAAVAATGATHVYVHLDLDVLDPAHFTGLSCPEPGGLHPDELRTALHALTQRFTIAGMGITEHAPTTDTADSDHVLRSILDGIGLRTTSAGGPS